MYRGEQNRGAGEKRATINRTVVTRRGKEERMRREDEKDEPHTLLTTEKKAFIHHCNNSDSKANKANVQKRVRKTEEETNAGQRVS